MKAIHTQLFWPTWVDSTLLAKTTKTGENDRENWYITAKCPIFTRKMDFAPISTEYILPQAVVKGNRNVAFFGKNISVFRKNSAGNFLPRKRSRSARDYRSNRPFFTPGNPYFFIDLMVDFPPKILYDKIANYGDATTQKPWIFADGKSPINIF